MEKDKSTIKTLIQLNLKTLTISISLFFFGMGIIIALLIAKSRPTETIAPIVTYTSSVVVLLTPIPISTTQITPAILTTIPYSPSAAIVISPTSTNAVFISTAMPTSIPIRPITTSNVTKLTFSNVINELAIPNFQPCLSPPDDYRRVNYAGHELNVRTIWMLKLAQGLYKGRGDVFALTQGSYINDTPLSFGTHAGGGVIDISVIAKNTPRTVLSYEEVLVMLNALRQAGFAAWLRLPEDLKPATGWHIHAVSVGDRELSSEARRQLDGPEGYFRGLDGIPLEFGGTKKDRYGGPIICEWMIKQGFRDLQ